MNIYETDRDAIEVSVHAYPDKGSIILILSDETTLTVNMDTDGAHDLADALHTAVQRVNS